MPLVSIWKLEPTVSPSVVTGAPDGSRPDSVTVILRDGKVAEITGAENVAAK